MSCGDRGGAGVYGWSVEVTVRELDKGKQEPRFRDMLQSGGGVPGWDSEDAGERAARAVLGRCQRAWEGW